jgi:hypothetical protein
LHPIGVADHDELSAAFDEVKASLANFADKDLSAHFPLYIANRAADDAAFADRFGSKDLVEPGLGKKRRGAKHLHDDDLSPAG